MTVEISSLNDFIDSTQEVRELKRALAVKMHQENKSQKEIAQTLNVSADYVSKWCGLYQQKGVAALPLGYKGSVGYLTPEQKEAVLTWLRARSAWQLSDLQQHYGVTYRSQQSYYALLHAAGLSWKKSSASNPQQDPQQVADKRAEIEGYLHNCQADILAGRRLVFFLDECHLLWGDVCGYVWGPTDQRLIVPITNQKEKQTYYGALDCLSGQAVLKDYPCGNSQQTIAFLKFLRQSYPQQRLTLLWDGASYHRSSELVTYLTEVNGDLPPEQWPLTCIRLAPYAPEQNPIEDVWHQAKRSLRQNYHLFSTFKAVKQHFVQAIQDQTFSFHKLLAYRNILQLI